MNNYNRPKKSTIPETNPKENGAVGKQKGRAFNGDDALAFLIEKAPPGVHDSDRPGFSGWFKPFDLFDVSLNPCPAQVWARVRGIDMMPQVGVAYSILKKFARHTSRGDQDRHPLAESKEVTPGDKMSTVWRINLEFNYDRWDELAVKVAPTRRKRRKRRTNRGRSPVERKGLKTSAINSPKQKSYVTKYHVHSN